MKLTAALRTNSLNSTGATKMRNLTASWRRRTSTLDYTAHAL